MTYGRVRLASGMQSPNGAPVSHSAELVRGELGPRQGPLIRPSGTFSPRGEGGARLRGAAGNLTPET
jgi:hypothetical protein